MSYREQSLVTADNHRFNLQWYTASSARAAIMLSPAMGVPAGYYKKLAKALAAQGVSCVITEHRGIASSSIRASRQYAFGYREMLEHDLQLALRSIQAEIGDLPLYLIGHSLGGQLNTMLASMRPHDVAGLILVASGSPYYVTYGRIQGLAFRMVALGMLGLAKLKGYFPGKFVGFGGRESQGVIADWAYTALTGQYKAKGMPVNFAQQFSKLTLPVLAINIKGDSWAQPGHIEQLLNKLSQAKITRWMLGAEDFSGQAVDHFTWARQADAMATHLMTWLSDQLPKQEAVA